MRDDLQPDRGGAQVNAARRRPLRPLLIPVVILLVLGIAVVAVAWACERAKRRECRQTLRVLGYVLYLYSKDFGGPFPPTLADTYMDTIQDGKLFLCPSATKATPVEDEPHFFSAKYTPRMFGDTHTDYVYVSGLRATDPPVYVLAFDDEWNHDGDGVYVRDIGGIAEWWEIRTLHEQLALQEEELAAQGRKMKLIRPAWSSWPDPPAGGHPLWGPRPWYKRRGGRDVAVGVFAALAAALVLVIRNVWRGRKRAAEPDQGKA
ncbi:MAG: hypothetical protein ACYTFI_27420 [Planctomycetota bacterium]|jgi:hypothetical protein